MENICIIITNTIIIIIIMRRLDWTSGREEAPGPEFASRLNYNV